MTVHRPAEVSRAVALSGTFRAGGTDLAERRRRGNLGGDVVDLRSIEGLDGIDVTADGARLGAMVTLDAVAAHPDLNARYGALARSSNGLGTPQIRRMATLGGSLAQATRCWYARSGMRCYRTGAEGCPARAGDHRFHVVFDLGGCVAPHPSTTAMALLLYDTTVAIAGGADRGIRDLLGDGSDPTRGNTLGPGELIVGVHLGPNDPGERTAYVRATARRLADWPLVECAVRLRLDAGVIVSAGVAVGGVAPIPLRLDHVEAALAGGPATTERLEAAASLAGDGASPLPGTRYKVGLLRRTVLAALAETAGVVR